MLEAISANLIANIAQAVLFRVGMSIVRRTRTGFRGILIRDRNQAAINRYMKELFARGSTIDVVSSRLGWIEGDPTMQGHVVSLARQGKKFRFHLSEDNTTATQLRSGQPNIQVYIPQSNSQVGEQPRFTLINRQAPGSTTLAVGFADGDHWRIDEFTSKKHPQIIAIARGYVEHLERIGHLAE